MKIYSNILLFLIFSLSANSQTSKIEKLLIKNGDTISFQKTGFNSYREIALLENNEFIKTYISVGCYPGDESKSEQYFGKYELIDSILLLKPNMVLSGNTCPQQAGIDEVAERTVACLKRAVPAAVPGIVFLSGGQSDEDATRHLNAMNKGTSGLPWKLSFSYGRALQAAPLKAWAGTNVEEAQQAFYDRAKANGAACRGTYN